MAEIVNLNRARKAKAKAEREVQARNNRVAFGRTKAEKDAARQAADKARSALDGKEVRED